LSNFDQSVLILQNNKADILPNLTIQNIISRLKTASSEELPGARAHEEMSPMKRPTGKFPERETARLAAVAVVLTKLNSELTILLTQRHEYEGLHSGQISFPGGKKDENDLNLEYTARRECLEEIGIILNTEDLLISLTEVYIPVSKFIVQPYVYFLEEIEKIELNQREVKELIRFPLHRLCSDASKSEMNLRTPEGLVYRNVPCFKIGEKEIWGATALILNELRYLLNT
jgi:8-oxo-dGTP pyrophosphatase MutT (NUDIX family)